MYKPFLSGSECIKSLLNLQKKQMLQKHVCFDV